MTTIIEAQALIPLKLHVSGLLSTGLNIESISFGTGSNIISFNAAPIAATSFKERPSEVDAIIDSIDFIQPGIPPAGCPIHTPQVYLIGESPRMMYIESFVTEQERLHLLTQSEPNFAPAYVYTAGGEAPTTDQTVRKSETAFVERDDLAQCIEHRARSLQENWQNMALEPMTVQRYTEGGFFSYHQDSFYGSSKPNRKSTFNVWLEGNCTGGGTHFPNVPRWDDPSLCVYLDCSVGKENGTVFKPIAGNALFWENTGPDGQVQPETLHAGLPVEEGTKIGLNIWTWEFSSGDNRIKI